jgi:hypothetical protein
MYIIQEENVVIEGGGKYNNQRGFNQGNQEIKEDLVGVEVEKIQERRKRPHNMI